MKIFNFEILSGGKYSEVQKQLGDIRKYLDSMKGLRPGAEIIRSTTDFDGVRIPLHSSGYYSPTRCYTLYYQSDILQIIVQTLLNGIFRRGFDMIPLVENPDEEQKKILKQLMHSSNENGQTLKDVLKMFEKDLDVTDDAYLLILKDYAFNSAGEIIAEKPKELLSSGPMHMKIVADSQGKLGYVEGGGRVYVDPSNRNNLIDQKTAESKNFMSDDGQRKLQPALYRAERIYYTMGIEDKNQYTYYLEGEVIHQSKFNQTLIYGYSNINALWMKVLTLIGQDRYFMLNYIKGRPPRGLLTIGTKNFASAVKAWAHLKEKSKEDPHDISPLLLENDSGKVPVTFTEFLKSPEEMQLIQFRNEARRQCGALYGVMPLFEGDLENAGGLNGRQEVQMEVTDIAVSEGQEIYNNNVFPWLLKNWGITDWGLVLKAPEERKQIEEAERIGARMDNANKMSDMGFDVVWDEGKKDFTFSEEPTNDPVSSQPFAPFNKGFLDLSDKRKANKMLGSITKIAELDKQELIKEGLKFDIKKEVDPTFLTLISEQLFSKTYKGLTKSLSNQINDVILNGVIEKDGLNDIIKGIESLGVAPKKAEMIARTEQGVLKNNIREFNFVQAEGSEKFLYNWIGPKDNRTSDISKEIVRKSARGLKLETLKNLVKKTSKKFGFTPDRDWFSHPNQRHSFVRKI